MREFEFELFDKELAIVCLLASKGSSPYHCETCMEEFFSFVEAQVHEASQGHSKIFDVYSNYCKTV